MGVAPSSPTLPVMSCEDLATLAEQNDKTFIAGIVRENEIDGKVVGMLDDEMLEEICPKKIQRAIMKAAMIIYHGDLGNEGTAALLKEVGLQVEEGLLDDFRQILEDSKQSDTVH